MCSDCSQDTLSFEGYRLNTLLLLTLSFCCAWTQAADPAGTVVTVTGTVRAGTKKLRPGAKVYPGQVIKSEDDGASKLLMADDTVLDVGPSSKLNIKEYQVADLEARQVEMDLELGRVRAVIKKKLKKNGKFRLQTRTSVLAVRGTTFAVDAQKKGNQVESRVVVVEGSLSVMDVATGSAATVSPGTELRAQARIEGNQVVPTSANASAPQPKPVSEQEVASFMAESSVEDSTFNDTVEIDDQAFEESDTDGESNEDTTPGTEDSAQTEASDDNGNDSDREVASDESHSEGGDMGGLDAIAESGDFDFSSSDFDQSSADSDTYSPFDPSGDSDTGQNLPPIFIGDQTEGKVVTIQVNLTL